MPDPREPLGRLVHDTRLACEAERAALEGRLRFNLEPWERRTYEQQETDMRIGAAVAAAERERLAAVIQPDQFRMLADWFDTDDEFKITMFPGTWQKRGTETQDDLRKFAALLEEPGNA
jgi:hypothetical protein